MITDDELVKLAAKAAGIEHIGDMPIVMLGDGVYRDWRPLEDDGDALRLAVKLNLTIKYDTGPDGAQVLVGAPWHEEFPMYWWIEWLSKDSAAATRRAVVRAAAEVAQRTVEA